MSDGSAVLSTLLTGGLGATIGGIVTAVLQAVSHRAESKASAADLVTKAAGNLVDRLDRENKQLREAILLLTDVLDDVLPQIAAPKDAVEKLKAAKVAAQKAV